MGHLPSGTLTLLFTDIEGSTALLRELGDEFAGALSEHRRVVRSAFARHDGVEVDTQGDAFFYVFRTAPDAVAAAAEAQAALAPGKVRVRMGIHTGAPSLTEEGYVGLDVHTAARVCSAGHGGQVVLTKVTRDLAGADALDLLDLGEHRLKDLPQPIWLFQLGDDRFPPLRSLSNTNLPVPASSFLGRARELEEAHARLDASRLLTVTGPGGTGKTRFAVELASRQLERFANGVFWVPLAPLREPSLVVEAIAQTVGASDRLPSHIADKRVLLLLDNFEQVVDAAPDLSKLLSACPNLTLLVTSRETLRVAGEAEYPLPPLTEDEGVALFCARTNTQRSEPIRELCRRLDGLPLAIELAAARAKLFTVDQFLERLGQRLDLLKGGRDGDPRQHTLRATIQWSHDLLSPSERRLFARLAVFAGGCTFDAAEEVAGADPDTLQSLVEKSLLRRTGDRFWMLETIREFALERLERRRTRSAGGTPRTTWPWPRCPTRLLPSRRRPTSCDWTRSGATSGPASSGRAAVATRRSLFVSRVRCGGSGGIGGRRGRERHGMKRRWRPEQTSPRSSGPGPSTARRTWPWPGTIRPRPSSCSSDASRSSDSAETTFAQCGRSTISGSPRRWLGTSNEPGDTSRSPSPWPWRPATNVPRRAPG